jgi:hypothetical protein
VERVDYLAKKPQGHRLSGSEALRKAEGLAKVRKARRKYPGSYANVFLKGQQRWQVSFYSRDKPPKEIAQVYVDDASGIVTEAWTGHQVAWTMARGYPGAFGRKVNDPLVWLPLLALFLAPFVVTRGVRVDLLVLAAFSVSLAYFNDANIDASVPLVYPLLVYLLGRMLWVGLRSEPVREPLRLLVPVSWLAIAVVFLIGFRVGLNVTSSNVIDVGYAGVIGADKLAHGDRLYGAFPDDNQQGDTYGPVAYAAYLPFEAIWPWSGRWDDLPASHAAAITFDLLCLLLLFLLGRMIRGPGLGVVLAYLWAAFPFTLYAANTNSNDSLVAVLVLLALVVAGRPALRGAAAALAGLTKFAPLALAPLLAFHDRDERGERFLLFVAGFATVAALALVPIALDGPSLRDVYDRTIGFQAGRGSPFSVWGLYGLDLVQTVWQIVAVGLALVLAVVPRRRDIVGLAALCGAILLAAQLGVTHWFYLYVVWFFPLVAIALFGRYGEPDQA